VLYDSATTCDGACDHAVASYARFAVTTPCASLVRAGFLFAGISGSRIIITGKIKLIHTLYPYYEEEQFA
jgi:hypothetical protein